MAAQRLEVRLDAERRRKLAALARERDEPVSAVIRELIDRAYREASHDARERAVERLLALEIEDTPDPAVLKQQLTAPVELPGLR